MVSVLTDLCLRFPSNQISLLSSEIWPYTVKAIVWLSVTVSAENMAEIMACGIIPSMIETWKELRSNREAFSPRFYLVATLYIYKIKFVLTPWWVYPESPLLARCFVHPPCQ